MNLSVDQIKKLIENAHYDKETVSDEAADCAVSSAQRALDREQRLLDRIVVLRYKENSTYEERIEYEALMRIMDGDEA